MAESRDRGVFGTEKERKQQMADLKAQVAEQDNAVKALKKGTAEYKKQKDILNKLKGDIRQVNKFEEKRKEAATGFKDVQDKIYKDNKRIRDLGNTLSKDAMRQASFNRDIGDFTQHINRNLQRAYELNQGISLEGRDLKDAYGVSGVKLSEMADNLEDVAGSQDRVAQLNLEMAESYGDIGTEGFDLSGNISNLEAELDVLKARKAIVMESKFPPDFKQFLLDEIEATEDNIEAQASRGKELTRVSALTSAAQAEILGPLGQYKSMLEGMPLGGFISEHMQLDKVMGDFAENTRMALANAFDSSSPETFGAAMNKIYDEGAAGIEAISNGFKSVNSMMGGMLGPALALVAVFMIAKKAIDMFYGGTMETRKELGVTTMEAAKLQNITNTAAMQFKMLGVSAEDVAGITKGIQENLGGVSQVTQETVTALASLNANFGVSGETATKLMATMQAVGSASDEAAISQLESVGHLARQNGVAPAAIIEDMASDMDTFASFAVDGGKNLAKAAISARKLGIDMATTAKMADSLLNFEDSINASMEAQMLTGRMINTDKAREMALAGDLDGMQREITSQIGSAAEFEAMNVVQRKALADAFGVSVGELSKMITNQDKLNNMTDSEKKKRDLIAGAMEQLGKAGTQILSALKSMIPLLLGILSPFILIAGVVGGILVAFGKVLEFLNQANVYGVGLGDVLMAAAGAALLFRTNLFGGGLMNGLKSMKDMIGGMVGKMKGLGGGAAKAVSGGASAAASGGAGVGETISKGGKGMGAGLKGLSKGVGAVANPKVLLGLAALTLAVIGVGFALKLAAPGIKAFGEAIGTIIKSVATGISNVIGAIGDFAVKLMTIASPTLALGLFATAAGFTALAGSMAVFATAGLLALPALLALTAFNAVTGAGGGGESENTMELELKKQNEKLDKVITLLSEDGPIAMNTEKGAKAGEGFIKSVIMA